MHDGTQPYRIRPKPEPRMKKGSVNLPLDLRLPDRAPEQGG